MNKKKLHFLLCISSFIIIIIATILSFHLFINKHIIHELNSNYSKASVYFSAELFNKSIFGETQRSNILKTKVLDVGNHLLYSPELVNLNKDAWIILIHKNSISIHSVTKTKTYEFKVPNENIVSGCISTLDTDHNYNILLLLSKTDSKYAEGLMIVSITEEKSNIQFKTICKKSLKDMKPWKIQTCDVDGDGKKEISIGMYKTTYFHPVLAKRPFLYQWTGKDIGPKWLGSRLSRPFDDYIFLDINHDGKDELVSIEVLANGSKVISAYSWKGFGFELIGESSEFQDVLEMKKGNGNNENMKFLIKAKFKNNISMYNIEFMDGILIAKKEKN